MAQTRLAHWLRRFAIRFLIGSALMAFALTHAWASLLLIVGVLQLVKAFAELAPPGWPELSLKQLRSLRPLGIQEGEGGWAVRLDECGTPGVVLVVGRSLGLEPLPALRLVAGDLPKVLVSGVTWWNARRLTFRLFSTGGKAVAVSPRSELRLIPKAR